MRILHGILVLMAVAVLLTGCGGAPSGLRGEVALISPLDTSVIYASALTVEGTAKDAPPFKVTLADSQGAVLSEATVTPQGDTWTVELVHGYSGEPQDATLTITPIENPEVGQYDTAMIILAALEHRPEEVFAYVISPENGDTVGGDALLVSGRASGLDVSTFEVSLIDSAENVLDSQTVTLTAHNAIDDVPWSVELSPGDYRGNAIIRTQYSDALTETIAVIITDNAG